MHTLLRYAKFFALLALLVVASGPTAGRGSGASSSPEPAGATPHHEPGSDLGRKLDRLLERATTFGFSGQVVVAKGGEVLLDGAYGFAERAGQRPMTRETRVGIGSLSKQLTAAAVLALREDGRLALDQPVSRVLPEIGGAVGALTLHQLLSHTGALPGGDPVGDDFEIEGREVLLRRIAALQLVGTPGERWRYANVGYNLLAGVVQAVAGVPYERFVEDRLLRPAGLEHTGFWHEPGAAPAEIAHAYRAWMDQGSPASWPRNWRVWGAGDVLSTAADLYRWELALEAGTVLKPASVRLMRSPQAPIGDTGDSYGYGWFLHPLDSGEGYVVEHGGDWLGGYNAFHYVDPSEGLVLTLTCNASDGSGMWLRQAVQKRLIDIAAGHATGEDPPAAERTADLAALTGTYALAGGDRLHLFDDGAYLWIAAEGQAAAELLMQAGDEAATGLARAIARTSRLYAGLVLGHRDAYLDALGKDGRDAIDDYWSEWTGLVERRGELRSFRILGARLAYGSASVATVLRFSPGGVVTMNSLWADGGIGRLHGTLVHRRPATPTPFPAVYPVARRDATHLIAFDPFREHGVAITVETTDDVRRLVISPLGREEQVIADRIDALLPSTAGWIPGPPHGDD